MNKLFKPYFKNLITTLLISVIISTIVFLLMYFLGDILFALQEEKMGEIFIQLKNQKIFVPFYIPLIFVALMFLITKNKKLNKVLKIILCVLISIVTIGLTLIFTTSNGVALLDILRKLIPLLNNGGLDL